MLGDPQEDRQSSCNKQSRTEGQFGGWNNTTDTPGNNGAAKEVSLVPLFCPTFKCSGGTTMAECRSAKRKLRSAMAECIRRGKQKSISDSIINWLTEESGLCGSPVHLMRNRCAALYGRYSLQIPHGVMATKWSQSSRRKTKRRQKSIPYRKGYINWCSIIDQTHSAHSIFT